MDIELAYSECGEGFPLVLLHGNGENRDCFINQIEVFAQNYRVLALDTRGHGESPRGFAPFTLAQFAEDLKCFLDLQGISRCHLLGFSDGGNIAMLFAMKYPDYVEKLILNGANLTPKGVKKTFQLMVGAGYRIAKIEARIRSDAVRRKELLGLMVNEPNIRREQLAAIKAPTLVIAGSNDLITTEETATIAAGIPNSTLCILRGGHALVKDNPAEYNASVLEFLAE